MNKYIKIGLGVAAVAGVYFAYKRFINMKLSNNGFNFLLNNEGKKYKMYLDTANPPRPTIGIGHLILPNEKHLLTATLTDSQVNELFKKDLKRFENAVNSDILRPIKQTQFDALVSFAYNIGVDGFKHSGVTSKINSGASDEDIIKAFSQWHTPPSVIGRRTKETRLFITGNYSPLLLAVDKTKYFKA